MTILVTGANGFLGSALINKMLEQNEEVIGLLRKDNKKILNLKTKYPNFKTVYCDITSTIDLENVIKNLPTITAIFHTAGKVAPWGHPSDYFSSNVVGTNNLLTLSKKYKTSYFIFTSSPSAVFGESSLNGVDETTPYPEHFLSSYANTKHLAEKLVIAANSKTFKTVCLRPHLILGPGDNHLVPTLLKSHTVGKLKIVGDGKNLVDVIHINNVVTAHLFALAKLKSSRNIDGQVFFLGQGPVELWPFINKIFKNMGHAQVRKKIPAKLAYGLGFLCEKVFILKRDYKKNPPMTRFIAKQLSCNHYFSHKKSLEYLGNYNESSLDDILSSYISESSSEASKS